MKKLTLLVLFIVLLPALSFGQFERLIFEDNFTEAADVYLNAHTPDYTFFAGQYYEIGGASYDCKISGAQDAVTEGSGTNPIFTNYFSLGAYTFPVRHDFTFRHAAYGTTVLYCFRRNDKTSTDGLQTLFIHTYYGGGTTATLYLRYFNGSIQTLATTTVPSFSLAKTWNMIIDDTGNNVKIYCDSVANGDVLGVATTLYLDIDTELHNDLTNHGYRMDSPGGTGNMFLYHAKIYDSLVATATPTESPTPEASATATMTMTPTKTPTATPTCTVTPTPDPQRKKFIYDNTRQNLKYDNVRRDLIYDSERRTLKKR